MHYYDMPARTPTLSLFLEPRSLVITTREQYTERAHGIDAAGEDRVGDFELANSGLLSRGGTSGAAAALLVDGGVLQRQTRYSLTCRDVARVMNVSGIGARKG